MATIVFQPHNEFLHLTEYNNMYTKTITFDRPDDDVNIIKEQVDNIKDNRIEVIINNMINKKVYAFTLRINNKFFGFEYPSRESEELLPLNNNQEYFTLAKSIENIINKIY
jgi:hypothetical protein